jgi:hypothetical protein
VPGIVAQFLGGVFVQDAIQELAGHKDLTTTQRYMHLSPAAIDGAIRLLEQSPQPAKTARGFGDILETTLPEVIKNE